MSAPSQVRVELLALHAIGGIDDDALARCLRFVRDNGREVQGWFEDSPMGVEEACDLVLELAVPRFSLRVPQ